MKRILTLFSTLAFVFLAVNLSAQAALGLTSAGVHITPDPVDYPMDSVLIIHFAVQNKGNADFTGPVFIYALFNQDVTPTILQTYNAVSFSPGDSIGFEISDFVNQARYKGGDNIIVIWPGTDQPFVNTIDSGSTEVFINGLPLLTGLNTPFVTEARLKIFPNPVGNSLNFTQLNSDFGLEYVRIYDIAGKEVYFNQNLTAQITTTNFKPGVYFLEVRYKDGKNETYKLVKAK